MNEKNKYWMKKLICIVVCLCTLSLVNGQKFEGLADTPPMGWSSWNNFQCNINEKVIMEIADAMVETGLRDAGYFYVNLDDCWQVGRDSLGFIIADPEKFPSGMKALADYIHSKGLKMGIYSDAGKITCGGHPGSLGHEYQDAFQYARWGIDYLKLDWCATQNVNPVGAYNLMRDALYAAGRPILFSMCEWGLSKPWTWAQNTAHMWRTHWDILDCFDCQGSFVTDDNGIVSGVNNGVLSVLDQQVNSLRQYSGPGHWNDPDMLMVGVNSLNANQSRAHFSMWCMLAAPLILGNDVRNMTPEIKNILLNKEVIAIDQDRTGIQGLKFLAEDGLEFWFKPLINNDWAFCILNHTKTDKEYILNWQKFNLYDDVSKRFTDFDSKVYNMYNLWSKKNEGNTQKNKKIVIPGEDVVLYRLNLKN